MELKKGIKVGPYQILDKISEGGMAVLYRAAVRDGYRERHDPQRVVLKIARNERDDFLKEEAEFLRRFSYPGVVHIYPLPGRDKDDYVGFVTTDDGRRPYFALEYVGGGTLEERLALRGRRPVAEAVAIAAQLARALDHVHTQGVVNRDVKPGNILFRETSSLMPTGPKVVLCDFGIALDQQRPEAGESKVGTFAYMSPEQVYRLSNPWVRIGPESDIYSLGVVLYEMLTGKTPFGDNLGLIIDQTAQADLPSSLRPGIPSALDQIVLQALDKDPFRRFRGAGEMAQALERLPHRVNAGFVAARTLILSLFLLAVVLAWQFGVYLQPQAGPEPTATTAPITAVATSVPATAVPITVVVTSVPTTAVPATTGATSAPPTRRPPTSTPIPPTPTLTPRPTRTPVTPSPAPAASGEPTIRP